MAKCLDKMDCKETGNHMLEAGVDDKNFVTMAKANETPEVAVKTPWGSVTERKELKNL